MKNIIVMGERLQAFSVESLTHDVVLEAKKLGFSDKQIASLLKSSETVIRSRD
jgi:carbamoyl-phosphate synthase/aspartate carbamoyltransferase/dihydroorotase